MKGNPRILFRLPEDHWLWQIKDSAERAETIRKALDQYKHNEKIIENVKRIIQDSIGSGRLVVTESELPEPQENPDKQLLDEETIFNDMDKFLDF